MAERWTDDRLDEALLTLGEHLDVPMAPSDRRSGAGRRREPQRWRLAAAAAAAVLVVTGAVVFSPTREAVARWFGLQVVSDEEAATATGSFADDVTPLDVDTAMARIPLDSHRLADSALGRPDAAGVPPEGGVVLAWDAGSTTLWVRSGDDDAVVTKRYSVDAQVEPVGGIGEQALLIEGNHELDTPARRVAAGRVLWWLTGSGERRLESDLDAGVLIDLAQELEPP